MRDKDKTQEQLIRELQEARQRIDELEDLEIRRNAALELIENIVTNTGTLGNWTLNLETYRLDIEKRDLTVPPIGGLGSKCNCQIHPDDLGRLKELLRNSEPDYPLTFTHRLVTPAGDVFTLLVCAVRWGTELFGAFRDLSPVRDLIQNLDIPWHIRTPFSLGLLTGTHQLQALRYAWETVIAVVSEATVPMVEDENISNEYKQHCMRILETANEFELYLTASYLSADLETELGVVAHSIDQVATRSGTDQIFIKDGSLKYVAVNDATCRFFELPKSKILGRTDRDLLGEESETRLEDIGTDGSLRVFLERHTRRTAAGNVPFMQVMKCVNEPLLGGKGSELYWGAILLEEEPECSELSEAPSELYLSPIMRKAMQQAQAVAKEDCTVLLTGETGAGKDHMAKYIHAHSGRANAPFFSINLGGLSQELADSELFGHERGAFTGAYRQKRGLLELAEGGTLLLNEIGDLSLPLQSKLLTFLDTRQFVRLGGEHKITINARLIAATNVDLEEAMEEGRFRKDLFYRINVVSIRVPSLRDRSEDIPALTKEILDSLKEERGLAQPLSVTPTEWLKMIRYDWPGGVRELRNVLERSMILSEGSNLRIHLPESASKQETEPSQVGEAKEASSESVWNVGFPPEKKLEDLAKDMKRALIDEAVRRAGGDKTKAARLLGITRDSIMRQIRTLRKYYGPETLPPE